MIDRVDALTQTKWRRSSNAGAKIVVDHSNRAVESLDARRIGGAIGGYIKCAIRDRVAETQTVREGVGEILNAHAHLTFGSEKAIDMFRILLRFLGFRGNSKPDERPEKGAPAERMRIGCGKCCHHFLRKFSNNYIVVVIRSISSADY